MEYDKICVLPVFETQIFMIVCSHCQ